MAGRCVPVSVMACVGALLCAACGGNGPAHPTAVHGSPPAAGLAGNLVGDRSDLRSPDVDGRMDPVSRAAVFACRGADRVEVFFDPRGTVALVAGGRPVVYGTAGTRAVNRACRWRGRLAGVPSGAMRERGRVGKLTCSLPPSSRFEVHPITVGDREVGSTVAVLTGDLRRILLSAVLERGGSRLYYGRACRVG
jgi:hypothetical protein